MDTIPVTPDGLAKLKEELSEIDGKIPGVTERLAAARAMGDLSENAEYHAAKEEIAWLNSRKNAMAGRIARCRIVDTSQVPKDLAVLGATVELEDGTTYENCLWTLERSPLEPYALEYKVYAPGVGVVLEKPLGTEEKVELSSGLPAEH